MRCFNSGVFLAAAFCAASVGAAEYRFEVLNSGIGGSSWALVFIDSSFMVDKDSSAPAGYEITYPEPVGTDSLTWRNRRDGLVGRTCVSCESIYGVQWLPFALSSAPLIPADSRLVETRQVGVGGEMRTYITAYSPGGEVSTRSAYLSGVGTVFFQQTSNDDRISSHGGLAWWSASVRLLAYNGINLDTLWGNELPVPTSITSSARREPATRIGRRRFDLQEMGIFLGRKSALKTPLPQTR